MTPNMTPNPQSTLQRSTLFSYFWWQRSAGFQLGQSWMQSPWRWAGAGQEQYDPEIVRQDTPGARNLATETPWKNVINVSQDVCQNTIKETKGMVDVSDALISDRPIYSTNENFTNAAQDYMPEIADIKNLNGNFAARPPHQQSLSKTALLEELYADMEAFEGCPLKAGSIHTVCGHGNPDGPLMLVGEAPGAEEDRQGKPFVGVSGQLLDKMLGAIGYGRDKAGLNNAYITNVVLWRPPCNRQPNETEIQVCLPFLKRHISIVAPRALVLLGSTAYNAILPHIAKTLTVTKAHEQNFFYQYPEIYGQGGPFTPDSLLDYHKAGALEAPFSMSPSQQNLVSASATGSPSLVTIPLFALYHPAFLLRSPGHKPIAWAQLQRVQQALSI